MDNNLQPLKTAYKAYNVAMSFIETESQKKRPSPIGSAPWINLKNNLSFLEKKKSDRVMNWLIDNWPPQCNNSIPYLNENERYSFDSEAYMLLLRSYKAGMVPEKFIEEMIVRCTDDGLHFSEDFLQNCLAKFWEDSMQDIQHAWIN